MIDGLRKGLLGILETRKLLLENPYEGLGFGESKEIVRKVTLETRLRINQYFTAELLKTNRWRKGFRIRVGFEGKSFLCKNLNEFVRYCESLNRVDKTNWIQEISVKGDENMARMNHGNRNKLDNVKSGNYENGYNDYVLPKYGKSPRPTKIKSIPESQLNKILQISQEILTRQTNYVISYTSNRIMKDSLPFHNKIKCYINGSEYPNYVSVRNYLGDLVNSEKNLVKKLHLNKFLQRLDSVAKEKY